MERLAVIQLNSRATSNAGSDLVLKPFDISYVIGNGNANGCADIYMVNGAKFEVVETVTDVFTAIDTLWTEYLTALGNP
jgi:argonaute-like protein implicated in RNA metabolism and viral defense